MSRFRIALAVAGLLMGSAATARAEMRALLIGFDDYPYGRKLEGAVADVDDLAGVLDRRGVHDISRITATNATVAQFRQAWTALTGRAKRGDLILMAFAGHGTLGPIETPPGIARAPGSGKTAVAAAPQGFEKGFLFPGYRSDRRTGEVLRDRQLYDLFKAAAARGLRVLFIADACHAGTGIRAIDPRGAGAAMRQMPTTFLDDPPDSRSDGVGGIVVPLTSTTLAARPDPDPDPRLPEGRPPIPGVAVISAQVAAERIYEYSIEGKKRGALSYAVARALEGSGASDGTGTVTVDGLYAFVRAAVRARSNHRQAPQRFAVEADGAMPILTAAAEPGQLGFPEVGTVPIHSLGAAVTPPGAVAVTDKSGAELIFDPRRRQLIDATGDVLVSDIDPDRLGAAVAARRLLETLRRLGERHGTLEAAVRLASAPDGTSDDRHYEAGAEVRFTLSPSPLPHMTVFNLSADGTAQFLFPRDAQEAARGTTLPGFGVHEPFGADFAVFVASDRRPAALHALFARSDADPRTASAPEVLEALREDLRTTTVRIGIQGLYTCRKLMENGRCDSMLPSSR